MTPHPRKISTASAASRNQLIRQVTQLLAYNNGLQQPRLREPHAASCILRVLTLSYPPTYKRGGLGTI